MSAHPDRVLLIEPADGGRRPIAYAEAEAACAALHGLLAECHGLQEG